MSPRDQYWTPSFSPCTCRHCRLLSTGTTATIKCLQMIPSCTMLLSQFFFHPWSQAFSLALKKSKLGCLATSPNVTMTRRKLSRLASISRLVHVLASPKTQSLEVGGNCIPFCSCYKDLGVYLDSTLSSTSVSCPQKNCVSKALLPSLFRNSSRPRHVL